jgi:type II secretory pathway component PulM
MTVESCCSVLGSVLVIVGLYLVLWGKREESASAMASSAKPVQADSAMASSAKPVQADSAMASSAKPVQADVMKQQEEPV